MAETPSTREAPFGRLDLQKSVEAMFRALNEVASLPMKPFLERWQETALNVVETAEIYSEFTRMCDIIIESRQVALLSPLSIGNVRARALALMVLTGVTHSLETL